VYGDISVVNIDTLYRMSVCAYRLFFKFNIWPCSCKVIYYFWFILSWVILYFYFWALHPVAFISTDSLGHRQSQLALLIYYIFNTLNFHFLFPSHTHYMFRSSRAIPRWIIQLVITWGAILLQWIRSLTKLFIPPYSGNSQVQISLQRPTTLTVVLHIFTHRLPPGKCQDNALDQAMIISPTFFNSLFINYRCFGI
jgi:hypothetical protein